jgi:hypothetical protein
MAFRKKMKQISYFNADIIVIQECEHPSKWGANSKMLDNYNKLWFGDNEHKGVGIFCQEQWDMKLSLDYSPKFKYVIPLEVCGEETFTLFAIWAMPNKKSPIDGYVGQIWQALKFYNDLIDEKAILVGDFNSNVQWDYMRKTGNHTDLVRKLNALGIHSVYHVKKKSEHGSEIDPTLYLLKKQDRPYHLDFCFAPVSFITADTSVDVGKYNNWISYSDHMPIFIDKLAES